MTFAPYFDCYTYTGPAEDFRGNLVLLHGWGMNSLVWDELIPLLNPCFTIYLIDLPGMGRSPLPSDDYNLDFLTAKVLEVAPEKSTWLAWSLGGTVLQNILVKYPERVENAFLLSATPCFVTKTDWQYAMPEKVFEKFQALLQEDWEGTLIRFLTLQCKGSVSIKEDTRKLRERLLHHGFPAHRALREGLEILKQNDLRNMLTEIKNEKPLHFILGEFDTLIPRQAGEQIAALNKNIIVHEIKGASHVPQISHPQALAEIIMKTSQAGRL